MSWSISNTSIATINQIGLVTAVQEGEAIITATTTDDSNLSAQCTVKVLPPVLVSSIQLPATEKLNLGGKVKLTAVILPDNASDKLLTWTTSDAAVATVADGLVIAAGYGTASITAATSGGAYATCVVTVDRSVQELRAVAYGLGIRSTSSGRYIIFSCGAQYGSAPYTVKYTLLSNGVELTSMSMTTSGVEALSYSIGSSIINATITVTVDATDAEGHIATARTSAQIYVNGWNISIAELEKVPIVNMVTGLTLDLSSATLDTGKTQQLTATVSPANASDKSLTWISSDPAVATVNETGLVTALTPGTASIAATAQDGSEVSAFCALTVVQKVTGLTLEPSSATLDTGKYQQLTATVSPANASDKSLTWASSDTAIATVDATGLVTALTPGTATIIATANDGSGVSAACAVTVLAPAAGTVPGDANGDNEIDIMDLVSIIDYIVSDTPSSSMANADANGDGLVDIMDLVWIIDRIVGG